MSSNLVKRHPFHYTRGGSTPFHHHGYRPPIQHNVNKFGGAQRAHRPGHHQPGLHQAAHQPLRVRAAPLNHNWEQEHAAATVNSEFESVGMVIWVDNIYGEILCEKNVRSSMAHFYFDGTTVIDGQTVAMEARSEHGLRLQPGTKIEFSCKYVPTDETAPHLVRILKMFLYGGPPKVEIEQLCMTSYSTDPHIPKLAIDNSGDFVTISPMLFSKEWTMQCIHATTIGSVPEYIEPDKNIFTVGRTFLGTVMKTPRWMSDGGVSGETGRNVRKILVGIEHMNPIIRGHATILKVVPFQSILLETDEMPGELMYFPIVAFGLSFKQQCIVGTRVPFTACKNLEGCSYPWRVIEINLDPTAHIRASINPLRLPKAGTLYMSTKYGRMLEAIKKEGPVLAPAPRKGPLLLPKSPKVSELLLEPAKEPVKDIWAEIFGIQKGTTVELRQNDLEEFLEMGSARVSSMSSASCESIKSIVSISTDSLESLEPDSADKPKYMVFMEPPPDPELVHEVLGLGQDDTEEAERFKGRCPMKCEYYHQVLTIAERLAESKNRRDEEKRMAEQERMLELLVERERRERVMEGYNKIRMKKHFGNINNNEKQKDPNKIIVEVDTCKDPVPGMRMIGLYDDVRWIFELALVENEENKQQEQARKQLEKAKKQRGEENLPENLVEVSTRPKDGFWFRRKAPRPLPTFYVAELLVNRTEEEFCQEYDIKALTKTVVLRNPIIRKTNKEREEVGAMK